MTKEEMEAILRSVISEERKAFWIEPETHYKHHEKVARCVNVDEEMRRNHEFVSSVRSGAELAKTTTIRVAVGSLIVFVIGAVWLKIKGG